MHRPSALIPVLPTSSSSRHWTQKVENLARARFLLRQIASPRMKETTCKKLQEIGGFALAGGGNNKRMKQHVEMIPAAREHRWVALYKIIQADVLIMAAH